MEKYISKDALVAEIKSRIDSIETAKLLKEKGFNEPVQYFYKFDSKELYRGTVFTNTQIGDKFYNAPTLQMAMKWLREEYNIDILITIGGFIEKGKVYFCSVYKNLINYGDLKECLTYEEACEAGIKHCLNNII